MENLKLLDVLIPPEHVADLHNKRPRIGWHHGAGESWALEPGTAPTTVKF